MEKVQSINCNAQALKAVFCTFFISKIIPLYIFPDTVIISAM